MKLIERLNFPYEWQSQDIWLFIPFRYIIPYQFYPFKEERKKIKLEWQNRQNMHTIQHIPTIYDTWAVFDCSVMRQIQYLHFKVGLSFVHLKTIRTSGEQDWDVYDEKVIDLQQVGAAVVVAVLVFSKQWQSLSERLLVNALIIRLLTK